MRFLSFNRRYRHFFLLVLLCLFPTLAGAQEAELTPTPTPDPKQKEVEWDAGIGLSTYNAEMKPRCWYPVWILIQANKADVKGVATISQAGNPLRVEVPIEAVKGSRKLYRSYYQPFSPPGMLTQTEINVQLSAQPIGSSSFPVQLRFSEPGDRHILILCEQDGAFNFLNRRGERDSASVLGRQSVIYSRPDLIPEDSVALSSLDAMVIDTAKVRQLTPAQWTAIRGWVAQGGQLLIGTGRHQPFIAQSPLKNPFGITITPSETIAAAQVFNRLGQTSGTQAGTLLVSWPAAPAGGWDTVWAGDEKHPFLAGKRIGRGWVNICASALDPPVLDLLKSRAAFAASALGCIEQPVPASALAEFAASREQELGMSLQRGFAINLADIGWVLMYLILYNLLAMPVNWWVCRKLGHPGLAWPILILTAVGFAWYGYQYSMERQQQNFQVNEVTFVSRPAEDSAARAISMTTLFSPRRINADMPAAGMEFLSRLALTERDNEVPLTLTFDQAVAARRVTMYPWTVFNVRGEYSLRVEGGVKAAESILTGPLNTWRDLGALTLTNATSHTFARWWLRRGNIVWPGKSPLEAGKTLKLTGLAREQLAFQPGNLVFPAIDAQFPDRDPITRNQPQNIQPNQYQPQIIGYSGRQPVYANSAYGAPGGERPRQFRAAADERLYFIGEASGVCSPFSQPFAVAGQKQIGCIFYEQPLPHRDEDAVTTGPWQPGEWSARVTRVGDAAAPTPAATLAKDANTNPIYFPLNNVILEFTPLRRRKPEQPAGYIDITYRFACYPDPGITWQPDGASSLRYRMLGCPVEGFNFKRNAWELLHVTNRGTLTLAPAEDYLNPVGSAFFLRLNATPPMIYYVPRNFSGRANEVVTGKALFESRFGVQMPMTWEDIQNYQQGGNYNQGYQGQESRQNRPPVVAQILDLKIRQYTTPGQ